MRNPFAAKSKSNTNRPARRPQCLPARLRLQELEDRRVLSTVAFLPMINAVSPVESTVVRLADFNNDGKLDLVTMVGPTRFGGAKFAVMRGNGDGTFAAATSYTFGGPTPDSAYTAILEIGDLNNDGKADIAVANRLENAFYVYWGNGDVTFQTPTRVVPSPSHVPGTIGIGDFNRDGFMDAVTIQNHTRTLVFSYGGPGAFPASHNTLTVPQDGLSVEVADFDRDGGADLGVAGSNSYTVVRNLNTPNPAVSGHSGINPGFFLVDSAAGKLRGAGQHLSAVMTQLSLSGSSKLVVMPGLIAQPSVYSLSVSGGLGGVAMADFNRDGLDDVIFGTQEDNGNLLFLAYSRGDGTIDTTSFTPLNVGGVRVFDIATGDINNDGYVDAVLGYADGKVLLQAAPSLVVTTAVDEDDGSSNPTLGTGTSLREAFNYARSIGGARTITFAPALGNANTVFNITGGSLALPGGTNANVTVRNDTGRVTINGNGQFTGFLVGDGTTLSLQNLTVRNFAAHVDDVGGAAYVFAGGTLSVNGVTFTNNFAGVHGSAINADPGSHTTVHNSTFYGNNGPVLALHAAGGSATIENNTIANNQRGGVRVLGGTVTLRNNIIVNNTAGGGTDLATTSVNATLSGANNIILTGTTTGLFQTYAVDPMLNAPADNGGPAYTMSLQAFSPALDTGLNLANVTADQRGVARPQGFGFHDIGAFEARIGPAPTLNPHGFAVYTNSPPVDLAQATNPDPAGGTFTGPGVTNGVFHHAGLTPGLYNITYTGPTANVDLPRSVQFAINLVQPFTTTNVVSSGPSTYGSPVTFTAVVVGPQVPVGSVTFTINGSVVASNVALVNGLATYTTATLPATNGTPHAVEATYVPTGGFLPSGGGLPGGQTVDRKALTTTGIVVLAREYDGGTAAQLGFGPAQLVGVVPGDSVSFDAGNYTANFSSKNAGDRPVTVSALGLQGPSASNYTVVPPSGLVGTIVRRNVNILFDAPDKVYDGTNAATVTNVRLGRAITGDDVGVNPAPATFSGVNVGPHTVGIPSATSTLTGTDAPNYQFASGLYVMPANITRRTLMVGGLAVQPKEFDGTTAATLDFAGAQLLNVVAGDVGSVAINTSNYTANFGDPAIGANKPVTVSVLGLTGPASGNYSLALPTGLTGSITEVRSLVVTTANDVADSFDGATSLREALRYAEQNPGPDTIAFAASLAGQTVALAAGWNDADDTAALRVGSDVTIQGLTTAPGVTIGMAPGVQKRHLLVEGGGTLTVSHLTFANGFASDFGGAIWSFGSLTARNSTFTGNRADLDGGAVHSAAGSQSLTLENCTFAGNTAPVASAVATAAASNIWDHLTVVDNAAAAGGGAFDIYETAVTMRNSVVARNTNDGAITWLGNGGGTFSAGSTNNLVGAGIWWGLNPATNRYGVPGEALAMGTLAANGGPTPTVALLPGSPAVNAGVAIAGLTADQRGVARDARPDAGAFEFTDFAPQLLVTTASDEDDGTADPRFGTGTSLREALRYAEGHAGPDTVAFAPSLGGQTVALAAGWNDANDTAALRVGSDVTIQGLTTAPGITIGVAPGVQKRHLLVEGGGTLTVSHLTFANGSADYGGSIWNFGSLTARNSTFAGNSANFDGGAVHSAIGSQSLTLENSTFAGNTSQVASAVATAAASNVWDHLTVVDNAAAAGGGAFDIYETAVTMRNSVVARNTNDGAVTNLGNGTGAFAAGSVNNLLGAGAWAGLTNGTNGNRLGATAAQLNAGTLGDNGGPTPSVALLPGSYALNAGSNPNNLAFDQRGDGFPRVFGPAADVGAFELQTSPPPAPRVAGVTVNAGQANAEQRSRVTSITVTFDAEVTFAGSVADAFGLARVGGGAVGGFAASAAVVNGVTVVTLSGFTGAETEFGSLADGRYAVTVRADQVSAGGGRLDGDGDGLAGGDYALEGTVANGLYRMFGDADGDGAVNAFDYGRFRLGFGSAVGQSTYVEWLDIDGDGVINAYDYGRFVRRFGGSVP